VTITAFGNRVIVACDDPQVLALAAELFRILHAPAGEGDFEVIRLKHAEAVSVARVLDEAFNGSPAPGGLPRSARIRIVPDPATNSLLVRAAQLDLLTIRHLLEVALDSPSATSSTDNARRLSNAAGGRK
jgi:type II secretory pathway component GspD/PulD (secretin)